MAVHSCASSRPISDAISRRNPPPFLAKFSGEFLLSGRVNFHLFRKKKISFPFKSSSIKSQIPCETRQQLAGSHSMYSGPGDISMLKWEKNCDVYDNHHFEEYFFTHQEVDSPHEEREREREGGGSIRPFLDRAVLIMSPFKFGTAVFFMANALMLNSPLEALAETCETDNSLFNMPLLLVVALVGATVGGLLARERKQELKRLNDQLRQINAALRRQAKIESYAPALSYAPAVGRISENEVIVDSRKHELVSHLKTGKNFLRNERPQKAYEEFNLALELAQALKDPIDEKKAARGLGASLQRQRKYRDAIKYHTMVLSICDREGEDSGITEAYGAIADCYTELGDLERAGKFYDEYIARLERD